MGGFEHGRGDSNRSAPPQFGEIGGNCNCGMLRKIAVRNQHDQHDTATFVSWNGTRRA